MKNKFFFTTLVFINVLISGCGSSPVKSDCNLYESIQDDAMTEFLELNISPPEWDPLTEDPPFDHPYYAELIRLESQGFEKKLLLFKDDKIFETLKKVLELGYFSDESFSEIEKIKIPLNFMGKDTDIDRKKMKAEGLKTGKIYLTISNYVIKYI